MPWSEKDVDQFKKGLSKDQKKKWVRRANGFLAACLDKKAEPLKNAKGDTRRAKCESSAITVANAAVESKEAFDAGQRLITIGIDNLKESIQEIDTEGRTVTVQIIQGDNSARYAQNAENYHNGWSRNGVYYSAEKIEELLPHVKKSRKMYMDHADFWSGRSMSDWTGTIIDDPWVTETSALHAKVRILPPPNRNAWILDAMRESPEEIGISIDAIAYIEEGEMHGIEGKMLKQWVRLNSADFVTEASAKGKFIDFSEALQYPGSAEKIDHILQELGYFDESSFETWISTEENPILENEDKSNNSGRSAIMELNEIKELTFEQVIAAGNKSVLEAFKNKENSVKESMQKQIDEVQEKLTASEEKVTSLEKEKEDIVKERDELKKENDAFAVKEEENQKREFIDTTCEELEIDKSKLKKRFVESLMKHTEEEIKGILEEYAEDWKAEAEDEADNPARGGDTKKVTENKTKKEENNVDTSDDAFLTAIKGR